MAGLCESCVKSYVTDDLPQFFHTYLSKGDGLALTRADIDRIPYASIAVRIGDSAQALLILSRYDGDDLHWISAKREVVVTRRGRVVRTYGLPEDLAQTTFFTQDPVGRTVDTGTAFAECLRAIDLSPEARDGVMVRSQFARAGAEDIEILGEKQPTLALRESAEAPDLSWNFVNEYWVDAQTGFVWKSRQFVTPKLPPFEIVVYRKPAAA